MSQPKGQHYVPQCYLGEWVDPNTPIGYEPYVWIFDRDGRNRRKKAPKNILKSKDLYTLQVKGQTKDYSIEKTLAKLESEYANIFQRKIKRKLPLSEYEHIILSAFVAVMLQRTLRHKDNLEKFFDELIYKGEALARQHGVESEEVQKWKEYKKDAHKVGLIQTLPDLTKLVLKMSVAFFCAEGGAKYITSDDPCNLFNPDLQWQRFYSPGLGQRKVEVVLSLSPEIMLCMSWSNLRGYIRHKKSRVEENNRMIVGHCYKYFVSNSPKIKRMWFRRYPMDFLFILKILRHKMDMWLYKLKMLHTLRNVRRK
ncbi:hypothetical protein ES703_48374 [subsurface metagenome]